MTPATAIKDLHGIEVEHMLGAAYGGPLVKLLRWFDAAHLPPHLAAVSTPCAVLAAEMAGRLPDGPELTTGLRKLLEAKDCFVRAAIDAQR